MTYLTKRYLRYLAACGIVGPILFATLILVASSLRPGYDQVSQVISELGANGSPNAWIQNVNFILFGVLIIAFALGLHLGINGGRGSKIGPILLVAFGLMAGIGTGVFPCDTVDCSTFDFHSVLSIIGFIPLPIGTFMLVRRLGQAPDWSGYRIYTLATGLLEVVIFILVSQAYQPGTPLHPWRGAIQRAFVVVLLPWMEVMAVKLFRLSSHPNIAQAPSQIRETTSS